MMTACGDVNQACVADEIIKAGGAKLKSCTSIIGPGGCITVALIPEIEKQGGSALSQDVCDPGQKCVPCTDPRDANAPTPFCQPIGVYNEPCTGGAAGGGAEAGAPPPPPSPCCTNPSTGRSNGVCLAASALPADKVSQMVDDTCAAGEKCAPASLVNNQPSRCYAGANGLGVCMDKCFNGLLELAGLFGVMSQDWCGPTELCMPCSFVQGQGVPGCQ
jgi:hypothetical protein